MTLLEWADRHATLFGLTGPAEAAMLAAWCAEFETAGVGADELNEATGWLFAHDPPRYRTDHLRALRERVNLRRRQAADRPPPPDDPRGTCAECSGTGRLVVPALGHRTVGGNRIRDGGTMAILCRCALGRWWSDRCGKHGMLSVVDYEREFPDWRQVDRHRRDLARKRCEADQATGYLDRTLGTLLAKLKAKGAADG